ncbi:thiamine biosynthesis protein [Desulfogranum mediterraneum]|uniref:thiamine biosynthesis protein n=1 Tax=Desulfogranum mediterraneum TaxID=160661 RepID=UPI00040AFBC2|nr:thiamine biosynthesis protein [Desulfogranum mediterraneum]
MKKTTAVGLFSGGLDSILACRVVVAQGIRVVALKFVTPFFDYELLGREEEYQAEVARKYGLSVELVDLSEGYLELLHNPAHGFGKHFNPCIDCKILMLTRARERMARYKASFLITGEVLGQRPMSQRRDTLRVIERESGCSGLLLRPLSAKLLNPTAAEQEGLVDRSRLHGFSGRGRKAQMQLAREFGITDYPNPAGGCILTDVNLGRRIERFYSGEHPFGGAGITVEDINLLLLGRQYLLFDRYWLILGRNEEENLRLEAARGPDDWLLQMTEHPGPTGLLRYAAREAGAGEGEELIRVAAGMAVRFAKKVDGVSLPAQVMVETPAGSESRIFAPLEESRFQAWRLE